MTVKAVVRIGNRLFTNKQQVDTLHQETAENFYPERATFTTTRTDGDEFADHLFSSIPVLARRELGNLMSASLRPGNDVWFSIRVRDKELDKRPDVRGFLERLTRIQFHWMYSPSAQFVNATKMADHDFAAFGNAVIHFGPNINNDGLLYRNYHLRDCAWSENAEGVVDSLHRNWKPTARQLVEFFPNTVSKDVREASEKDPEKTFAARHAVVPSSLNPKMRRNGEPFPFTSTFIELETENVLEETGLAYFPYIVPRWQKVSGSPYGCSMATSVLLPDGRTMQAMVRTLREAGEKFVDPPMLAVSDAIRSDIALYSGGITNVDIEYDQRLGEALRPISQDRSGVPIGMDMVELLRQDIASGFFLDKIQLPAAQVEMTAFEVRRRLEEHIRASAPIFEPIQENYNAPLNLGTFELLSLMGAFPMGDMPEALSEQEIAFEFRSPLSDLAEAHEAETFLDIMNRFVIPVSQIDPAQIEQVNLDVATRDALRAAGAKQAWLKDADAVARRRQELEQAASIAQGIDTVAAGGEAASTAAEGLSAIDNA